MREYLSRVTKKSFIIMTFLGPLLLAGFYGLIGFIVVSDITGDESKTVAIYDPSGFFKSAELKASKVDFTFTPYTAAEVLDTSSFFAVIEVPTDFKPEKHQEFHLYSKNNISVQLQSNLSSAMRSPIRTHRLAELGVEQSTIDSLRTSVSIIPLKLEEDGEAKSTNTGINTAIGMALSFVIYFFIFLYGVQVMKGVIEEKTNRIVELIISTVKPFQLMMGKVIGLALVGLTQILAWIVLSGILTAIVSLFFGLSSFDPEAIKMVADNQDIPMDNGAMNMLNGFFSIPFGKILISFPIYFIGGYLLYGALFAAIGAAVDSETDTQQFMLPVTIPLVFALVVSMSVVINDPNGTLATTLSMIPFTSPITMMIRMPFDPPWIEIILSMVILTATFIFTIWMAGRIYKVGILMYGKKVKYKDLFKWMFSKH
jgi:ABC-2 type transport system permease protein